MNIIFGFPFHSYPSTIWATALLVARGNISNGTSRPDGSNDCGLSCNAFHLILGLLFNHRHLCQVILTDICLDIFGS